MEAQHRLNSRRQRSSIDLANVGEVLDGGCAGDRLRLLSHSRMAFANVWALSSFLRGCKIGPSQFANSSIAASRSNPSTIISQSIASPCAPQPKQWK
jgi:hypothetical protein